jgi:hypothetical protein
MKNRRKRFEAMHGIVIIALVAVIGFGVAGCEQPTDDPAHVHQWEWTVITPATCIATGEEEGVCKLDPSHTTTREIAIDLVNGHDWEFSNVTKAATCTSPGDGTRTCKRTNCGESKSGTGEIPIDPNAHNWNGYTVTNPATCIATGTETDICSLNPSDHTRTRIIAIDLVNGHNWNTETGLCGNNCGELYYELGDTGPGGGKIFYVSAEGFTMTDDNSTAHYLEAAPADMVPEFGFAWASEDYISTNIDTGEATGTGRKNTALILATDVNAPAAKACNDYSASGKTDWFLPSKDELNLLYVNRTSVGNVTSSYWSSSQPQRGEYSAWHQTFTNGYQNYDAKHFTVSVRAVRAF